MEQRIPESHPIRQLKVLADRALAQMGFRWFLDMDLDEVSFDASTFSRNRERLIRHEVAERFLAAIVEEARKGR